MLHYTPPSSSAVSLPKKDIGNVSSFPFELSTPASSVPGPQSVEFSCRSSKDNIDSPLILTKSGENSIFSNITDTSSYSLPSPKLLCSPLSPSVIPTSKVSFEDNCPVSTFDAPLLGNSTPTHASNCNFPSPLISTNSSPWKNGSFLVSDPQTSNLVPPSSQVVQPVSFTSLAVTQTSSAHLGHFTFLKSINGFEAQKLSSSKLQPPSSISSTTNVMPISQSVPQQVNHQYFVFLFYLLKFMFFCLE